MSEKTRKASPEATANILSKSLLWWTFPLIYSGWKKPIVDADLWELRDHEKGRHLSNELSNALSRQAKSNGEKPSLFQALRELYIKPFVVAAILRALVSALGLLNPMLLNNLIRYVSDATRPGPGPKPPISVGVGWALSLLLVPVLYAILENQYYFLVMRTGMQVRSAVQGILYDKSLKMSPSARAGSSLGEIVNLMQMDTQRLDIITRFMHLLWSCPLLIFVTCALLFRFIRWSAVIGVALTFSAFPLQGMLVAKLAKLRRKGVGIADERVKLMNEILQGMKAVKFYGWGRPFLNQVEEKRKEEIDTFGKTIWVNSTQFAIALSVPVLIAVITFSFYAGVFKNDLDPATVFTAFTLLNMLRGPVIMLPAGIAAFVDARLSVQRVDRFLDMDNCTSEQSIEEPSDREDMPIVSIKNGSFTWGEPGKPLNDPKEKGKKQGILSMFKSEKTIDKDLDESSGSDVQEGSKNVLHNISLKLKSATLTAVVGKVGSGKSSLVSSLLGETIKTNGNVYLNGSVAYVPQTAWIFNATLRNNIVFGKDFNEELYKKAIEVSALQQDIDVLPAGDLTAIGEKGINLSGGQKQRVSLARAVYADADIYIFDDPLSALDAHVGQEVFEKCISNLGVLNEKIRLLVTNQVHVLEHCDNVVFLEEGAVRNEGSYESLISSDESFRNLVDENEKEQDAQDKARQQMLQKGEMDIQETEEEIPKQGTESESIPEDEPSEKGVVKKKEDNLIQAEERVTGNVSLELYGRYAKACGGVFVFSLTLIFWVVVVALGIYNSYWLAYWSDEEEKSKTSGVPGRGLPFYIGIYVALGIGYSILTLLSNAAFGILALQASKNLHAKTLRSVLNAPMAWFDTTPIGRILSRFSRDIGQIDTMLPESFRQMVTLILSLMGAYVLIAIILPPFLGVAAPITLCYFLLQRFFNRTSLEVKRLDNISKSPIYAHFSETLSGLSTLRAYKKQISSTEENRRMIDINTRAYFTFIATSRWFSLSLELLGAVLIFCTALFAVVARGASSAAQLGLSLAYALQVTSILGFTIRSITELEANMSSVERMEYYSYNIPQEAAAEVDYSTMKQEERPSDNWPEYGNVSMTDVALRYRENLDLVLKGVNIEIKAGEKVGIIGRTGSGKSTLMVALLRIVELAGGSIEVDGVDISNLGLDSIRKSITVIPQDPVLFSGTIRKNLDPFGVYTDEEMWDVLEKSGLKAFVSEDEEGLDAVVSEYGENLSAGQRQLICLSRALLRRSKILILDEASSSLDAETDAMIQGTIREQMKDATILTIAHRLFTLADYDKILVMEHGRAVEMGSPKDLLNDKNSKFNGFVAALGSSSAEQFKEIVFKGSASKLN